MSRNFVLIHGAWHGGWCWQRVVELLERGGHRPFAPTLAGLADRAHLAGGPIGLKTHIDDVVRIIEDEALEDIVLVGHSYGGFVISGVAERVLSSIESIIFLDAFFPGNGQSLIDMGSRAGRDAVMAALEKGEEAVEPFSAAFFRVNEADQAWVDRMCTPHPIKTFVDPISLSGKREQIANKVYIRAVDYPSVPFDNALIQLRSDPAWRIYEIKCGHDAMIDMPERLTEILIESASR